VTTQDEPRQRLLETAGQIFAEKGLKGATVRAICKRAGVNIAAVNYYFRDKERLYIEAVKNAACGSLESVPLPAWAPGTPPVVKLRDFIRVMVGRLMSPDKPAWHARLMMRELTEPTSACAEWVEEYVRPHAKVLREILGEALPPGTSDFRRWQIGFSIIGQCLFYLHCKPVVRLLLGDDYARITPEVVAEHVAEFSLAALGLKA
jgi:TetR/AcrR family transcriptional regulator, regulator of cefoperazone and chloramphenicol sensitivity